MIDEPPSICSYICPINLALDRSYIDCKYGYLIDHINYHFIVLFFDWEMLLTFGHTFFSLVELQSKLNMAMDTGDVEVEEEEELG